MHVIVVINAGNEVVHFASRGRNIFLVVNSDGVGVIGIVGA